MNLPKLNWKDIELIALDLRNQMVGSHVDKIFIPKRKLFKNQFIKGELAIRTDDGSLVMHLRPQNPYLYYQEGKGFKSDDQATRSPFILALNKALKGKKILKVDTLDKERIFCIWFSGFEDLKYGLLFSLIPSSTGLILIESERSERLEYGVSYRVISHSRKKDFDEFIIHQNENEVPEFDSSIELRDMSKTIEEALLREEFNTRQADLLKIIKKETQQISKKSEKIEKSLHHQISQDHFEEYAELIKANLHRSSDVKNSKLKVIHYHDQKEVEIPIKKGLSLQDQMKQYFLKSKKLKTKKSEEQSRLKSYQEKLDSLKKSSIEIKAINTLEDLVLIETKMGFVQNAPSSRKKSRWSGKTFQSKDESSIWIGRNSQENHELLRVAKGNDVWLHVKGKPGAHGVIPLLKNQSASLETLLDTAHLVIYFSDGKSWGKTEVDYTYRKYVKKIKGSKEVTYSQNKTLIIEIDEARLNRLLGK